MQEEEEEEDGPKKKRKSKSRENSDDEGKKKKKGETRITFLLPEKLDSRLSFCVSLSYKPFFFILQQAVGSSRLLNPTLVLLLNIHSVMFL